MSIRYYDEAILEKISNWLGKESGISISGPNDKKAYWMKRADESQKDIVKLPLIGLSRGTSIELLSQNKKPLSFAGRKSNQKNNSIAHLNGIPIDVNYQLDIYTRLRNQNDDLVREFIFKIINNPQIKIEIPYKNSKIQHISNIRLTNTINDNSDINEHLINGEYFRTTLNLYVDDAYLFDYKYKDIITLEIEYDDEITKTQIISSDKGE